MGTYRTISPTFWNDAKVSDCFTAGDKYVYLYLLTNPKTNICGCYELSRKQIVLDTGLEQGEIAEALDRLARVHQVIGFCEETREVLIYKWGRYNWTRSEKLASAVRSVAEHIKCREFREYVLRTVEKRNGLTPKEERTKEEQIQISDAVSDTVSDTDVSIGYRYPMDRVSETEKKEAEEADRSAAFEQFWNAYPACKRKGKAAARNAFLQVRVPAQRLLTALEAQKQSRSWQEKNGQFIPSPVRWLEGERWEDGPETPAPSSQGGFTPGEQELQAIAELSALKDAFKE